MKERHSRKSSTSISSLLCLATGIALVLVLAYFKAKEAQDLASWERQHPPPSRTHSRIPRKEIASLEIELDGYRVAIATKPVSQEEFRQFVHSSGYVTWRERWGYSPNWQSDSESSIASWLNREDAEAYCQWLAKVTHTPSPYPRPLESEAAEKMEGFRLPTIRELEALERLDPQLLADGWEWTANSLADLSPEQANGKQYLTARKAKGETRHRRSQDMGHRDVEPTGFRLAWSVP